jgi:hypothetical protein
MYDMTVAVEFAVAGNSAAQNYAQEYTFNVEAVIRIIMKGSGNCKTASTKKNSKCKAAYPPSLFFLKFGWSSCILASLEASFSSDPLGTTHSSFSIAITPDSNKRNI